MMMESVLTGTSLGKSMAVAMGRAFRLRAASNDHQLVVNKLDAVHRPNELLSGLVEKITRNRARQRQHASLKKASNAMQPQISGLTKPRFRPSLDEPIFGFHR
jgi:hypothetical protein